MFEYAVGISSHALSEIACLAYEFKGYTRVNN
jgi:hypothetical protein